MAENWTIIVIGFFLILASILARGFSYGMAPHHEKPIYPATTRLRVVLLCFGLASLAFGIFGVVRR